ncbi:hypothetical protein F1880_005370 [Penicillium rolfsii]|nr:hypothetical protein F1880_005370 [Penicillium rolfsii]
MSNGIDCDTKQTAEEYTHKGQMTIGEMLQRYPRAEVERAIFDFNFSLHRAQTVKRYQDSIARGVNVDQCQQVLKEIEENMPPGPPVDPDEPQHLDAAVLWRIKLLKYEYRNGPLVPAIPGLIPGEDIRNVNAVLSAYRRGELQGDRDKVTVWFAGQMVLGPRPREGVWEKIREEQKEWTKVYGKSWPWVEDVCEAPDYEL